LEEKYQQNAAMISELNASHLKATAENDTATEKMNYLTSLLAEKSKQIARTENRLAEAEVFTKQFHN
tara:strand:+ start:3326 stop:3526 length:201 start_codon:yes stop_codon:yes gene_type:complete